MRRGEVYDADFEPVQGSSKEGLALRLLLATIR